MWHQGKLKRMNYNIPYRYRRQSLAVFQLHDLHNAHAIFLAFGYSHPSKYVKICQIMKVNDYQNNRITQ